MKTIQDLFKQEKQAWLDDARVTARKLLKARPFITIEELLADNLLQNSNVPDDVRIDAAIKEIMLEVGVVV